MSSYKEQCPSTEAPGLLVQGISKTRSIWYGDIEIDKMEFIVLQRVEDRIIHPLPLPFVAGTKPNASARKSVEVLDLISVHRSSGLGHL